MNCRQLVILAGGKGTRLRSVLGDRPKPMAEIGGIPVLEHQVRLAARYGMKEVIFLTSYLSDHIRSYFGTGERWGICFRYEVDETPLGTAGATLKALPALDEDFLLLYGDAMLDVDLARMVEFHKQNGADATLFVHPNDHPHDSDLIEMSGHWITALRGYPHPEGAWYRNLVNAGLYVLRKSALERYINNTGPCDFAKELFPQMLAEGMRLAGYLSREYIKDMGTPARLEKVRKDHEGGRIAAFNIANPLPAIFLDRDGTMVKHRPWLCRAEDVVLENYAAAALKAINGSRMLAVLVTNQPVIARGECTFAELERIHGRMEHLLGLEHAHLDAIYFCPHHPHSGYAGEVPELKVDCACRKPKSALFLQAAREHNIDLAQSWMIGDSTVDIEAARRAGMRSILVETGEAGKDGKFSARPSFTAANVLEAVRIICESRANSSLAATVQ